MKKVYVILMLLLLGISTFPMFGQRAVLNDEEKTDILLMMEEEKLARDVYVALGEKWDLQVFENITLAEERHLSYVVDVAAENDLEVPVTVKEDRKGEFVNVKLQSLYDELVAAGNVSKEGALRVGARIEELDIRDLDMALANTENVELIELYTPLREASKKHLQAFSKNLENMGIEYQPVILSSNEYSDILNGAKGKGACCSDKKGKDKCCSGKKSKSDCKGKKGKGKSCCAKKTS